MPRPKLTVAGSYRTDGIKWYIVTQRDTDEMKVIETIHPQSQLISRDNWFEDALNWAYEVGSRDALKRKKEEGI